MYMGLLLEVAAEQVADRRKEAAAARASRGVARAARRRRDIQDAQIRVPMSAEVAAHAAAQTQEMSGART